jgi:hypothetical protein
MAFDPSVQVAFLGVMGTALSAGSVAIVAILNNRRERTGAAETGVEETLRERLALREDQIRAKDERLAFKRNLLAEKDEIIAKKDEIIAEKNELINSLLMKIQELDNG